MALDDLLHNRGRGVRHALKWRAGLARTALRQGLSTEEDDYAQYEGSQKQTYIYSVAAGPLGEQTYDVLRNELGVYGVLPLFGGSSRPTAKLIHIEQHEIEPLARCLLDVLGGEVEIYARVRGKFRRKLSRRVARNLRNEGKEFDLLVVEKRIESADAVHIQCSRIEVAVWSTQTRAYNKRYLQASSSVGQAARMRRKTFDALAAGGHNFDDDFPADDAPQFPIDVVYTWVDGDDPDWRESKSKHAADGESNFKQRVFKDERFRSRDELKYSLRSLELFAPWVRKIFIVTADQVPDWLNVDHPKIEVVSHRDIYRTSSHLPTFNSSSIETQLHHIDGLSRHFLYFNDDFFLGQLCDPSDFFFANGVLRSFPGDQRAYEREIDETSEEYIQADKNALELFMERFEATGRAIMQHVPYPSDRELLAEMESLWQKEFDTCAEQRFRSSRDLRPIAFMQYHYGFQTGRSIPSKVTHRYLALWSPHIEKQMQGALESRSCKTLCINDVGLADERVEEVNAATVGFLTSYFPLPSAFERVLGDPAYVQVENDASGVLVFESPAVIADDALNTEAPE